MKKNGMNRELKKDLKTITGFTDEELEKLETEFSKLPVFPDLGSGFYAVFVEGAAAYRNMQGEA
ncbi:hypothetical protein LEP1GSC166_1890 [Leptospira kirschneri]|uniref:hypothetical protein n=1 Tax=Leptospira kirschneri TaxID=29507 RepID=UPI0002BDEF15|nr:hypothetical protein [Leptospira kirschneri]EMK02946.1 hypothetical protein LEP1GSC166_1890 [Leptospira kirschneri]